MVLAVGILCWFSGLRLRTRWGRAFFWVSPLPLPPNLVEIPMLMKTQQLDAIGWRLKLPESLIRVAERAYGAHLSLCHVPCEIPDPQIRFLNQKKSRKFFGRSRLQKPGHTAPSQKSCIYIIYIIYIYIYKIQYVERVTLWNICM